MTKSTLGLYMKTNRKAEKKEKLSAVRFETVTFRSSAASLRKWARQ